MLVESFVIQVLGRNVCSMYIRDRFLLFVFDWFIFCFGNVMLWNTGHKLSNVLFVGMHIIVKKNDLFVNDVHFMLSANSTWILFSYFT